MRTLNQYKIPFLYILLVFVSIQLPAQPVKNMGQLQVIGTQLTDEKGRPIALHGVSFGWSCFHPRFYTAENVSWLKKDWNCNVVRAAMGVEPKNGYFEDKARAEKMVTTIVDAAIEQNIYVIIDWHCHNIKTDEAIEFFDQISKKYSKYPNVIYEIFNEPERVEWSSVKIYSEKLIATIRKNDPDNLILVGCPHWSQDLDKVAADPIKNATNIMYTMHFYAGTHKQWLRDRTDLAIRKGIPVFISESAGMEATGDGPLDLEEWDKYITWMDRNNLSWITWSVSDKDESCSMLNTSASSIGNWTEADLKESGLRTRQYLKSYDERGKKKLKFDFKGRIEQISDEKAVLIGSASSVSFTFIGDSCSLNLKNKENSIDHNWISLEMDGKYSGRLKIENGDAKNYPIKTSDHKELHRLTIYKATEATNGGVIFDGSNLNVVELIPQEKKKIEFIGNSITCGYGADMSEIPCDKGEWFDQHNAYLAYGPRVARQLDVDFLLSSVSGIGIYRNWNDEHQEEAIMPEVYENLYLINGNKTAFTNTFQPDIVSICLGTNDLSDGDGTKKRLEFSTELFISNYIKFIEMIYRRYPETNIVLLNSTMLSPEKNKTLMFCLNKIKDNFKDNKLYRPIEIFEFNLLIPGGCDYHPGAEDHRVMAEEIAPLYKKILDARR